MICAAHYFLIGAWSGAALNILAMARETVFFNKDKKWASSRFWMYLFAALTLLSGILTWEGPSSLLPAVGSVCAVISFWCTRPIHIRLLAIPAQGLWTIYNIIHRSLTGGISSGLQLVSVLLGLARDLRERRRAKEQNLTETADPASCELPQMNGSAVFFLFYSSPKPSCSGTADFLPDFFAVSGL